MGKQDYSRQTFYILLILLTIVFGVIMKAAHSVSLPVIVSVLLACVCYPIVRRLNRQLRVPWAAGTILMALVFVTVVTLLSSIIGTSLTTFLNQYSKYESRFLSIYKVFADTLNLPFYDDKSFFENIWSQMKVREIVQQVALSFSGNLISFAKSLGMVLLLMVFLLIEMRDGREKIDAVFRGKVQGRIMKITKKIITETVRFISIKFFISLATGVLVYVFLRIVRVDFAVMWGFFAFVMNFIPTFGSIFSVLLTTLFALLQFYPALFPAVFVFVSLTLVNLIFGNILEPRIEGTNLGLSPFVILVSLLFWGWMWGFAGMILAVPVMVVLKIICENVSFLHGIAILLGNRPLETLRELSAEEPDGAAEAQKPEER